MDTAFYDTPPYLNEDSGGIDKSITDMGYHVDMHEILKSSVKPLVDRGNKAYPKTEIQLLTGKSIFLCVWGCSTSLSKNTDL